MSRKAVRGDGLGDVVRGALAGAAATWVMGQVIGYLYQQERESARRQEDEARGGKTAYGVAAEKAATSSWAGRARRHPSPRLWRPRRP